MDLNAAVQGPDDACEVLPVSLGCQPDWHTGGLTETTHDSIHDVNPSFFFPTILKRSGPFNASKVCVLVWKNRGQRVSFQISGRGVSEYSDHATFGIIGLRNTDAANLRPDMICVIDPLYIIG